VRRGTKTAGTEQKKTKVGEGLGTCRRRGTGKRSGTKTKERIRAKGQTPEFLEELKGPNLERGNIVLRNRRFGLWDCCLVTGRRG